MIKQWEVTVTQGKSDPAKQMTRNLRFFFYRMRSHANLVDPQILGFWWSCDRPMPARFPAPPPKPGKSALGTRFCNGYKMILIMMILISKL